MPYPSEAQGLIDVLETLLDTVPEHHSLGITRDMARELIVILRGVVKAPRESSGAADPTVIPTEIEATRGFVERMLEDSKGLPDTVTVSKEVLEYLGGDLLKILGGDLLKILDVAQAQRAELERLCRLVSKGG